ncbi:unnamed protein product, partial [Mesorhabditis belari]|uniref:non-specific serine/threonine protein kinase n=1 Tax=Mesorhabditis belari TaxID=2138241 RepID=A0AAF3EMT0_9BILA
MFSHEENLEEKEKIGDPSAFGTVYKLNKYHPSIVVKEIPITGNCGIIKNEKFIYSIATIAKWAVDLFSGLVYLKSKRRVHRDIKPANVFVSKDFVLKIGDFGIAETFGVEALGGIAGTPAYMAPEARNPDVCELNSEDSYKIDVYAAGLVLWEVFEREFMTNLLREKEEISFSFKFAEDDIGKLVFLISSCGRKFYRERIDVNAALQLAYDAQSECSAHEVLPRFKNDQKRLIEPIGIDGSSRMISVDPNGKLMKMRLSENEDFSLFLPPDVTTFSQTLAEKSSVRTEPEIPIGVPKETQILLDEMLAKVEIQTNFHMSTMKDYFNWRIHIGKYEKNQNSIEEEFFELCCPDLELTSGNSPFNDINQLRKTLCETFMQKFNVMNEEEKTQLAEDYLEAFAHSNTFKPFDSLQSMPCEGPATAIIYSPTLYDFQKDPAFLLFTFDLFLQSFSFQQAFFVLMECHETRVANWDLLNLIEISIRNIEELEKIFTQRLYFRTCYLMESRELWCESVDVLVQREPLYFKQNLTQFCRGDENREEMKRDEMVPIDIEALRRALYQEKTILERYLAAKLEDKAWDVDTLLCVALKSEHRVYKDRRLKLPLTSSLPFPDYFFAFHLWPGFLERTNGKKFHRAGGFPLDLDSKLQVPFAKHHTKEQRHFVEMYTRYVKIFFLLSRWKEIEHSPEILHLLGEAIDDHGEFKFVCLYVSMQGHEGLYLENLVTKSIILSRDFERVKSTGLNSLTFLKVLGFVEIEYQDLVIVGKQMVDGTRLSFQASAQGGTRLLFPEIQGRKKQLKHIQQECIADFWKRQTLVLYNEETNYRNLTVEECETVTLEKAIPKRFKKRRL